MQVLICTYGAEGIAQVVEANHPHVDGVSWLVSWQNPDNAALPTLLLRDDFTVIQSNTRGLSLNRNIALQNATDEIVLISDDDVRYTATQLTRIMQLFADNTDLDIITFRYHAADNRYSKQYPDARCFDLKHPAKGYYLTSFELAFRLPAQRRADVWFDERFGIASPLFVCGEEQLFLHRMLRKGLQGRYFAEELCTHAGGPTTTERLAHDMRPVEANSATKVVIYPCTWLLRQIVWAFRQSNIPKTRYITASIKGAYKLFKSWITGYPKTRTCC